MWVHVRTASARRGDSNEYLQSMFLSKNKKIRYTPVLLLEKWGSSEYTLHRNVFVMFS